MNDSLSIIEGVEINGYIQCPVRGLCIWLQQRSPTKQTWPNKWDNMVSGGLSVGYGIKETAIKEAAGKASKHFKDLGYRLRSFPQRFGSCRRSINTSEPCWKTRLGWMRVILLWKRTRALSQHWVRLWSRTANRFYSLQRGWRGKQKYFVVKSR